MCPTDTEVRQGGLRARPHPGFGPDGRQGSMERPSQALQAVNGVVHKRKSMEMRFLIAGVSGIAGLLCLMAAMGGFRPRLQTIIIGLVLLLVAVLVARSRRKEPRIVRVTQGNQGGQGRGQTTTPVKEMCSGSNLPAATLNMNAVSSWPAFATCTHCGQRTMVRSPGYFQPHDRSGAFWIG